jgi:hypothetical protein
MALWRNWIAHLITNQKVESSNLSKVTIFIYLCFMSDKKWTTFYETIGGKEEVWKPSKNELENYKKVCFKIWGGAPLDVTWAMGTPLYKNGNDGGA